MDTPILIDPTEKEDGPWWVKFATLFGVPALIAVYLVWSLASDQGAVLRRIEQMLYAQQAQVTEVANVAKETSVVTAAASVRMQQILTQICVNSAETVQERNACLNIR